MASTTSTATPPNGNNFQEYSGHKLIAICVALMVLEILCVGLRFVSRHLHRTATGLDDWLIGPSFFFCFGLTVLSICMVKYAGSGRHNALWVETEPSKIMLFRKYWLIVELFYTAAFTLPRLSILAMYMRIFTSKIYRMAVYVLALIMLTFCVTAVFISFFKCRPLAYLWDRSIPGGHCLNITEICRWINLPNMLIDVVIIILPLPLIWRLHVSRNQKIDLTVTFLTSGIGLIASIARFIVYFRIESLKDATYDTELLIWTSVEPGLYLMAACFPTYRPLFPLVYQFISSSSLLSHSLKPDIGDISSSGGTLGGCRAGIQSTARKDESFVEDGDRRGLVNSYRGEEGSVEGGSEGFTAEGVNDNRIHVISSITVERTSSIANN